MDNDGVIRAALIFGGVALIIFGAVGIGVVMILVGAIGFF